MKTIEDLAQRFDRDRRHLKSVAFHLLGSVADAEDAVQSAWLKASRADHHTIENLTGWFTTITAREAVDQLRARKRRAEQPIADPDQLERIADSAQLGRTRMLCSPNRSAAPCWSSSIGSRRHSGSPSCCTTCSRCPSTPSANC